MNDDEREEQGFLKKILAAKKGTDKAAPASKSGEVPKSKDTTDDIDALMKRIGVQSAITTPPKPQSPVPPVIAGDSLQIPDIQKPPVPPVSPSPPLRSDFPSKIDDAPDAKEMTDIDALMKRIGVQNNITPPSRPPLTPPVPPQNDLPSDSPSAGPPPFAEPPDLAPVMMKQGLTQEKAPAEARRAAPEVPVPAMKAAKTMWSDDITEQD
jgi:hypothetical protein